jgi:predicted transposase YbfD/YdcC
LWDALAGVPDPRSPSGKRFPLQGLLGLAVAALLAGRQGLAAIARWGRECSPEQLRRLGIPRDRAPCHAAWHKIFKRVGCDTLEQALAAWTRGSLPAGAAIAMDGKTLRGSRYADYPAVHLLAVYCDAISGVLGQRPVDTRKANEITEAAALLKAVPVKGMIITGDAMFAQRAICEAILERAGEYVFTVKDNQPALRDAIDQAFAPAASPAEEKKAGVVGDDCPSRGKKARARGRAFFGSHAPAERVFGLARRRAGVPGAATAREGRQGKCRDGMRHHQFVAGKG